MISHFYKNKVCDFPKKSIEISIKTKSQSESSEWLNERFVRITASKCFE